jgi:CUB/sushi domain-containing protein
VGDATRVCRVDGTLNNQAPTCHRVECDKPGQVISNGRMIGSNFTFNNTITYTCDEGYR